MRMKNDMDYDGMGNQGRFPNSVKQERYKPDSTTIVLVFGIVISVLMLIGTWI